MCTICEKKFENLNKEKHQKCAHRPTLEQLSAHTARMQNKQKLLECTYQDLHKQNNTLSLQMLHQQKTQRPTTNSYPCYKKLCKRKIHMLQENI